MNSPKMPTSDLAILLIGYNRPDFIIKRIAELGDVAPHKLFISIDGGSTLEIQRKFLTIASELRNHSQEIEFWLHSENLGLVKHIVGAISKVLVNHEYILVIEDDITLAPNYVENIRNAITSGLGFKIATFGGFSPLVQGKNWSKRNGWRRTKYFSAWGWCISKSVWSLYSHEITESELIEGLKYSRNWSKLSTYQKSRWMYRFRKIVTNPLLTWDYQMQFMSFKHDLDNVLPIFRISDNEGFADERSTNTKASRPRWMGTQTQVSERLVTHSVSNVVRKFLETLDSFTIAGDSKIIDLFHADYFSLRKEL